MSLWGEAEATDSGRCDTLEPWHRLAVAGCRHDEYSSRSPGTVTAGLAPRLCG